MKVMTIAANVPCIHLFVLISGYGRSAFRVILKCMRSCVVGEGRPSG